MKEGDQETVRYHSILDTMAAGDAMPSLVRPWDLRNPNAPCRCKILLGVRQANSFFACDLTCHQDPPGLSRLCSDQGDLSGQGRAKSSSGSLLPSIPGSSLVPGGILILDELSGERTGRAHQGGEGVAVRCPCTIVFIWGIMSDGISIRSELNEIRYRGAPQCGQEHPF